MSTIKIQINGEEVNLSNREEYLLDYLIELGNRELKSQDNLDFLKKFEKKIQEAKEQEKKGLWRPKYKQKYWFIGASRVNFDEWFDASMDKFRLSTGNVFATDKEAYDEVDRKIALTRIKDYIAREGIERKKDWFDGDTFYSLLRNWGFSVEDTEKIIQACESDLKILFEIK